jgi:putative endonuclease
MAKSYFVYILTNERNTVLYTGVTNDINRRTWEHEERQNPGFTARYKAHKLIWYESFSKPSEAIAAEKRIKGWNRGKKLALIMKQNPQLEELRTKWR